MFHKVLIEKFNLMLSTTKNLLQNSEMQHEA